MTSALDPQRAVEYLGLLSTDLEAVAVLSADGSLLAGEDTENAPGMHLSASSGDLTISASLGRNAQLGLFKHDLHVALRAIETSGRG